MNTQTKSQVNQWLMLSPKISALLLDGLVGSQEFIDAGRLTMLPLFLGPSRAVLDGIPAAAEVAQSMGLECSVAGHVGMGDDGECLCYGSMIVYSQLTVLL